MTANAPSSRLFVSTGCSSSDLLLAPLLAELRRRGAVGQIQAFGGEPLREQGAELLYDSTPLSTIGTTHGVSMFIRKGIGTLRALRALDRQFAQDKPDLVILVDNAGINFRVLSIARRHHVPVLYYIPPELWSVFWFELGGLKKSRPKIAAIFSTQAQEYQDLGLDADWIGHPMLDLIDQVPRAPRTVGEAPVIGIFPGSRRQEYKLLLDPMRRSAERILKAEPHARFILCAANSMAHGFLQRDLARWNVPVELRYRQSHDVLAETHLALVCSGTVTLEAALIGVPMVAMYRISGILDNVLQRLVLPKDKYRHFSLPNVLLNRGVVTELCNRDVNPERIARESLALLRNEGQRQAMLDAFAEIRPILGEAGAVQRVADIAERMLAEASGRDERRAA